MKENEELKSQMGNSTLKMNKMNVDIDRLLSDNNRFEYNSRLWSVFPRIEVVLLRHGIIFSVNSEKPGQLRFNITL